MITIILIIAIVIFAVHLTVSIMGNKRALKNNRITHGMIGIVSTFVLPLGFVLGILGFILPALPSYTG